MDFREILTGQLGEVVQYFYNASTWTSKSLAPGTLKIIYVLLFANSPLDTQLTYLSGFVPFDNPGKGYRLYEVDREKLSERCQAYEADPGELGVTKVTLSHPRG